jgi:hypothetical protein
MAQQDRMNGGSSRRRSAEILQPASDLAHSPGRVLVANFEHDLLQIDGRAPRGLACCQRDRSSTGSPACRRRNQTYLVCRLMPKRCWERTIRPLKPGQPAEFQTLLHNGP